SFYLVGATQTLFLIGPPLYLIWRVPVMRFSRPAEYLAFALPYFGSTALFLVAYAGVRGGLRVVPPTPFLSPVYCLAVLRALTSFRLPTGVTEKVRTPLLSPLLIPSLLALVLCAGGLAAALVDGDNGLIIASLWAAFMLWALGSFLAVGLPFEI